jgi:hypothetical protein
LATPLALVESELSFDKNPRLANGRGFFYAPAASYHRKNHNKI